MIVSGDQASSNIYLNYVSWTQAKGNRVTRWVKNTHASNTQIIVKQNIPKTVSNEKIALHDKT